MDIFNRLQNLLGRPKLRPNCLLTRYPVCFIANASNPSAKRHFCHEAPRYLAAHGYDARVLQSEPAHDLTARAETLARQLMPLFETHQRVHLLSYGESAMDALQLTARSEMSRSIRSVTMVDPDFQIAPEVFNLLSTIEPPRDVMFGSIFSGNLREKPTHVLSWQLAQSLGPTFNFGFQANSPSSDKQVTLPMYLDHCIFLAEFDLIHAE